MATTMPQHLRALERANEIRLARCQRKRDVLAGETTVADLLREMPSEIEGMRVYDLLAAQRWWGRVKTRKLMLAAQVSDSKTIGSLTDRQRGVLIAMLERRS